MDLRILFTKFVRSRLRGFLLKIQPAFPCAFRYSLHPAVIQITAAVESHILQPQLSGLPRNGGAYQLALLYFRNLLRQNILFLGTGSGQRRASLVVDQLCINLAVAPEHRQPGLLGRTADLAADAELDFLSSD